MRKVSVDLAQETSPTRLRRTELYANSDAVGSEDDQKQVMKDLHLDALILLLKSLKAAGTQPCKAGSGLECLISL